jgi:ser/thr/tyr protein kinase RAD53
MSSFVSFYRLSDKFVFPRLTNCGPFIEDVDQRDIRTRIAERQVDWDALTQQNVSRDGKWICFVSVTFYSQFISAQDFIIQLLKNDPRERMSLSVARNHPWLSVHHRPADYARDQPRVVTASPSAASLNTDGSMLSDLRSEDTGYQVLGFVDDADVRRFEHMQLDHEPSIPKVPGAFTNGQPNGKLTREESRTAPLQRRSHVMSQAAEGDANIPQPSDDMVNHASNKGARGNKRPRSQLTPLPEDVDRGPLVISNSSRKKGKLDNVDMPVSPLPRKTARGKAPPSTGRPVRTRASGAVSIEDDKLRRSTRQVAPKTPRRV